MGLQDPKTLEGLLPDYEDRAADNWTLKDNQTTKTGPQNIHDSRSLLLLTLACPCVRCSFAARVHLLAGLLAVLACRSSCAAGNPLPSNPSHITNSLLVLIA